MLLKNKIPKILYIKEAIRLVWESSRFWTTAGLLFTSLQGILPLAWLFIIKLMVDAVIQTTKSNIHDLQHVLPAIAAAGFIFLLNAVLQSVGEAIKTHQGETVTDHIYEKIHSKSAGLDYEYFENPAYQNMLYRVRQDATFRPNSIVDGLVSILQNLVSLVLIAGLFWMLSWWIVPVLFAATIPGFFVKTGFSKKLYNWQLRQTENHRRAYYYHQILTGRESARENRLYGLFPFFMQRFADSRKALRDQRLRIHKQQIKTVTLTHILAVLAIFSTFIFIARQTISGTITVGDFTMYFLAFSRGLGFLNSFLNAVSRLYEDSLFLEQLYEFFRLPPKKKSPGKTLPFPSRLSRGIVFKNVGFRYPGSKRQALCDIDMDIPAGKMVAIVGRSGSGKSTLVKLLCRLYDPTEGSILADGIDIKRFDPLLWHSQLSVVFQDHVTYAMTGGENIRIGNLDFPQQSEKIVESAKQAGIHETLENLPDGYDTMLGNLFGRGEQLSTGEWQRVALARAFFRNAPVMVFDEPTRAMDAAAESHLFDRLKTLPGNKTVIIVSHRFSTVKHADLIYVLDDHGVVEKGTHQALLDLNGRYADLYRLQAQNE